MIEIKEYEEKYAEEFAVARIKENFNSRTKVFIALEDNNAVGTAGIDKSWYNDDGEYWILTVFVKSDNHRQGIGT